MFSVVVLCAVSSTASTAFRRMAGPPQGEARRYPWPIQCYDREELVLLKAIAPGKKKKTKRLSATGNCRQEKILEAGRRQSNRVATTNGTASTAWQSGANGGGHVIGGGNRCAPNRPRDESRQKLTDRASEACLYLPTDAMQGQNGGWFREHTVGLARTALRSVTRDRIEGIVSYRIKSCVVGRSS